MLTWASLALQLLKVGRLLLQVAHDKKQFNAGAEHASLEHAKDVLAMSEAGRKILERINALSDDRLDDLLDAVGSAGDRR